MNIVYYMLFGARCVLFSWVFEGVSSLRYEVYMRKDEAFFFFCWTWNTMHTLSFDYLIYRPRYKLTDDWYTLCSGQFYAFDNNNKEACIHIYSLCHIITLLLKMIFNFGKCKRCIEFVIHLIWEKVSFVIRVQLIANDKSINSTTSNTRNRCLRFSLITWTGIFI